jgi:hypothetical protein
MEPAKTSMNCSACDAPNKRGKWICQCGNILDLGILRHEKPADRLPENAANRSPLTNREKEMTPTGKLNAQQQMTVKFDPVHGMSEIFMGRVMPVVNDQVDLFSFNLAPLEMYLCSKISGKRSADELSKVTGLGQVELGVLLMTLLRTGAVTTVAKVSVTTVVGEGALWGGGQTKNLSRAAADSARNSFNEFRRRRSTGNIDGAALSLKKALAVAPTKEYAEALQELMTTSARRCADVYERARWVIRQGSPKAAVPILECGLAEFPKEAGFYNLLAVAVMGSEKNTKRAIDLFRRACEIDPDNLTYLDNLERLGGSVKKKPNSKPKPRGLWRRMASIFG